MKNLPLPSLCLLFLLLLMGEHTVQAQHSTTIAPPGIAREDVAPELGMVQLKDTDVTLLTTESAGVPDFDSHRNPCQVFIGVGTNTVSGQLTVAYTVDNTPATACGILKGDIILTIDGVRVTTQSELVSERNKHQPGDAFTLSIRREGKDMTVNARFRECSREELEQAQQQEEIQRKIWKELEAPMAEMKRMEFVEKKFIQSERPILGIFPGEKTAAGVVVSSVITGKGAESAGLLEGDVITEVDGVAVGAQGSITSALATHKPGDQVTVAYTRDGQMFKTSVVLSADRSLYAFSTDRDPCAVFIGVYTGVTADEQGVRVSGVIDGTPAKESGVQPGDVIVALDGAKVNTYSELCAERDKHLQGQEFQLSVLRDGAPLTINAKFRSCKESETPVEETVEMLPENAPVEAEKNTAVHPDSELKVALNAFPNPTSGPLNVRFEAEAVPTTVRIMDASGKVVYHKVLSQFGGYFDEQLNLFGNTPGTYTLTVQQGAKTQAKQIVLMPRA